MEKILVIGASGFLGQSVSRYMSEQSNFEVHQTFRKTNRENAFDHYMDLEDKASIAEVLNKVQPSIVINCSGVIGQIDDIDINARLTSNLLESLADVSFLVKRIIISGSAAEYGYVLPGEVPVDETVSLRATQGYGLSKAREESLALELKETYNLPVVVARIFNPIGSGMGEKFLVSSILRQVAEIKAKKKNDIEVSRLDSCRDYIAVEDVAGAFKAIIKGEPGYSVYNIGSGVATSNQKLIELMTQNAGLKYTYKLTQTSDIVEPLVASQARIERMKSDFGWVPTVSIDEAVSRITRKEDDKQ